MDNVDTVKSVPAGVKVISVLYYIGSIFGLLFALLFFFGAGAISSFTDQIPVLSAFGTGLFIIAGVITLAFSILGFFVARGLWKGKNWTRIFVIILSILGILMGIFLLTQGNIISNVSNIIINLIIGGYLLFSHSVKEAFTSPIQKQNL